MQTREKVMNKLLPILVLLFSFIFEIALSFEYVADTHSDGSPKTVRTYAGYSEIGMTKEIGYYPSGLKKYEVNYYDGKIKNSQAWDSDGKKTDFKNLSFIKENKDINDQIELLQRSIKNLDDKFNQHLADYKAYRDSDSSSISELKRLVNEKNDKSIHKAGNLKYNVQELTDSFNEYKSKTDKNLEEIDKLLKDLSNLKDSISSSGNQEEDEEDFDNSISANREQNTKAKGPDIKFIPFDTPPTPKRGKGIRPIYPKAAKDARIEGTIYIQFFIDVEGDVTEAYVTKGLPGTGLDEAALIAIKNSKWKPARQGHKKVGVWQTTPIHFTLGINTDLKKRRRP